MNIFEKIFWLVLGQVSYDPNFDFSRLRQLQKYNIKQDFFLGGFFLVSSTALKIKMKIS